MKDTENMVMLYECGDCLETSESNICPYCGTYMTNYKKVAILDNLETKLKELGFKSILVEDNNPNNVYVKVWFNFEMNGKIHTDGRQEFYDIGNTEEILDNITEWINKEKCFKVILE